MAWGDNLWLLSAITICVHENYLFVCFLKQNFRFTVDKLFNHIQEMKWLLPFKINITVGLLCIALLKTCQSQQAHRTHARTYTLRNWLHCSQCRVAILKMAFNFNKIQPYQITESLLTTTNRIHHAEILHPSKKVQIMEITSFVIK